MTRWSGAVAAAALLLAGVGAGAQSPMLFAHNPALSPDGARVAFDWCGDIWVAPTAGGAALRLTSHPSPDIGPAFSPDGRWLAFTSSRGGGNDVYLMPADGGEPKRLTFHAASDTVNSFTPDGRAILFASLRWTHPVDGMRVLYQVPVDGGTPVRVQRCLGSDGALSPDGTSLAFVRYGGGAGRRGYRGPATGDIWLHDLLLGGYRRLTENNWADESPQFTPDGQTLYFISEEGGRTRQVWRRSIAGGAASPLTRQDWPVTALSLAADGRTLVFESGDRLWRLELPSGRLTEIELTAPIDAVEVQEIYETRTNGADDYAVNPAGTEVAFTVRGDIYIARFPEGGPTVQLTNTPHAEGGLMWSPDGKALWFSSDEHGQSDLYTITSGDPAEPRLRRTRQPVITRVTETKEHEGGLQWSPDGTKAVYLKGEGDIVVADAELKNPKTIHRHWTWSQIAWSPDSRWLAFSCGDANYNNEVYIISADGGEARNVSLHPMFDGSPAWTGDGTKLAWLSERANEQIDVYYVWLRQADFERTRADRADAEDDAFDRPKPPEGQAAPAPAADAPKPVEIEFDGMSARLVRLTATIDSEGSLVGSPKSGDLAYTRVAGGARELVLRNPDGGERPVGGSGGAYGVSFTRDGKRVLYLRSGGSISSASTGNLRQENVSFSAEIHKDLRAERLYIFDAAWRGMADSFYDLKMHGVDWQEVHRLYRPRAAAAPSRDDFNRVVNEMLGELNSSHQGFGGGPTGRPAPPAPPPPAGDLGINVTDDRGGPGLIIESVVENSPAAKQATRLSPGERILSVDGTTLAPGVNFCEQLLNRTGVAVTLEVQGTDGARRTMTLRPISFGEVEELRYQEWLRWSQAKVDELSGGRLGWTHIRSMSDPSTETFIRDLTAAGDGRDGLLIDVRWNGGGSTADIILAMIGAQPHAITQTRSSPRGYPWSRMLMPPWTAKAAMLANYASISNAEILAHAFQVLKRGPVIGTPTYGGVLSTGGISLLDGSSLRTPMRGWYRLDDGRNQENNPCRPEVEVWMEPTDEEAGRDPQLEAAVKALLATL